MQHCINAYKDGYKWVTFCEICGQEEPMLDLSTKCTGEYKNEFISDEDVDKIRNAD